jgi:hypothetical protein
MNPFFKKRIKIPKKLIRITHSNSLPQTPPPRERERDIEIIMVSQFVHISSNSFNNSQFVYSFYNSLNFHLFGYSFFPIRFDSSLTRLQFSKSISCDSLLIKFLESVNPNLFFFKIKKIRKTSSIVFKVLMILPLVHQRKPCYDFSFL